jgi:hypothetical protein
MTTPDTTLSDQISKTYKTTRTGLACIAIVFPILLLIGGYLAKLHMEGSMSAYYHASVLSQADQLLNPGKHVHPSEGVMRNWFVGLLFALGIILILYRGFTRMETVALTIAGLMGLGVALFPMPWGDEFRGLRFTVLRGVISPEGVEFTVHGAFAVGLFLCIGYVCIFRAPDTLQLIPTIKEQNRYHFLYRLLGGMMLASPLIAFVLSSVLHKQNALTFFIEFAGIWVFAAYWLVKGHEMSKSDANGRAARGELRVVDETGKRHPFRKIQIQPNL